MKYDSLSLYAGHLVVGDGRVLENQYLGIVDGIINEVSSKPLEGDYADMVDYSDKYVMPGLIDAHVHLRYDPFGDP